MLCWRSSSPSEKLLINRLLVGICGRETISEKNVKNGSFEVHKKILGKDKPTRVIDFLKKASLQCGGSLEGFFNQRNFTYYYLVKMFWERLAYTSKQR